MTIPDSHYIIIFALYIMPTTYSFPNTVSEMGLEDSMNNAFFFLSLQSFLILSQHTVNSRIIATLDMEKKAFVDN